MRGPLASGSDRVILNSARSCRFAMPPSPCPRRHAPGWSPAQPSPSPSCGSPPRRADQRFELFGRRGEPAPVGAAQHQGHAEIAAPEIGVGADLEVGMAFLQRREVLCQGALAEAAADAAAQHLVAALRGDASAASKIALHDAAARRAAHRHCRCGTRARARSGSATAPRLPAPCAMRSRASFRCARRVMGFEQPPGVGVQDQLHAECVGDALRGDVVMGRADPAGGKDIIEAAPHLVDRGDDRRRDRRG